MGGRDFSLPPVHMLLNGCKNILLFLTVHLTGEQFTAKWGGCENPVQYAGPLFCRLYLGHLWTNLHPNAAGRGTEGGWNSPAESAMRFTANSMESY